LKPFVLAEQLVLGAHEAFLRRRVDEPFRGFLGGLLTEPDGLHPRAGEFWMSHADAVAERGALQDALAEPG
jgi:hypothetical protein